MHPSEPHGDNGRAGVSDVAAYQAKRGGIVIDKVGDTVDISDRSRIDGHVALIPQGQPLYGQIQSSHRLLLG